MQDKNYYEEKIEEIKKLIDTDQSKALAFLQEELNMPYIPEIYEKRFQQMLMDLFQNIEKNASSKTLSAEQIIEYMESGDEIQVAVGIDNLRNINLNSIKSDLKNWIENKTKDKIAAAFVIEALIEQKIDVQVKHNGQTIHTSSAKSMLEQERMVKIINYLDSKLLKEPQILGVAIEYMKQILLLNYPFVPQNEDLPIQIENIARYTFNNELMLSDDEKSLYLNLLENIK